MNFYTSKHSTFILKHKIHSDMLVTTDWPTGPISCEGLPPHHCVSLGVWVQLSVILSLVAGSHVGTWSPGSWSLGPGLWLLGWLLFTGSWGICDRWRRFRLSSPPRDVWTIYDLGAPASPRTVAGSLHCFCVSSSILTESPGTSGGSGLTPCRLL